MTILYDPKCTENGAKILEQIKCEAWKKAYQAHKKTMATLRKLRKIEAASIEWDNAWNAYLNAEKAETDAYEKAEALLEAYNLYDLALAEQKRSNSATA